MVWLVTGMIVDGVVQMVDMVVVRVIERTVDVDWLDVLQVDSHTHIVAVLVVGMDVVGEVMCSVDGIVDCVGEET